MRCCPPPAAASRCRVACGCPTRPRRPPSRASRRPCRSVFPPIAGRFQGDSGRSTRAMTPGRCGIQRARTDIALCDEGRIVDIRPAFAETPATAAAGQGGAAGFPIAPSGMAGDFHQSKGLPIATDSGAANDIAVFLIDTVNSGFFGRPSARNSSASGWLSPMVGAAPPSEKVTPRPVLVP